MAGYGLKPQRGEMTDDPSLRAPYLLAAAHYHQPPTANGHDLAPPLRLPAGEPPVVAVRLLRRDDLAEGVAQYTAAGVAIDLTCSDRLCGVCAKRCDATASGDLAQRDFMLSRQQRAQRLIRCCAPPRQAGGALVR